MFFLAFAVSIRIFTLFLNLGNSEIFLIPAIILVAIVFAFFQRKTKEKPPFGKGGAEQSEAEGFNNGLPLSRGNVACDKGVKIPLGFAVSPFKKGEQNGSKSGFLGKTSKQRFNPFLKNLLR
jgi:hypothetical protein